MGDYYSVSGVLRLDQEQIGLLKKLLSANEDENPYVASWIFHQGGWEEYAFFGHTVKEYALGRIRAQLQRITDTIQTKDPDLDWLDYVEGRFCVESPYDNSLMEWVIANGKFHEYPLAR